MSRPWMKWYPRDWRADPRLRMCSLAARGLWIEVIGFMHEAEPYGYLLIDGKVPDLTDIAALVGRPVKEVRAAWLELGSNGVFTCDEVGAHSRRMLRDNARTLEGRENIEKRWATPPPNRDPNSPPNRVPIRSGHRYPIAENVVDPITQKPEAREPERKEDPPDGGSAYAFESGVIKLAKRDFDLWKASFSHLDVPAELVGMSGWAETEKNWFMAVKGLLTKRNREVGIRKSQQNGRPLTPAGNPWPEGIT